MVVIWLGWLANWLGFWTPTNTGEAQRRRANQQQPKANQQRTDRRQSSERQGLSSSQSSLSLPPILTPSVQIDQQENTCQRTQVSLTTITPSNLPSSLNTRSYRFQHQHRHRHRNSNSNSNSNPRTDKQLFSRRKQDSRLFPYPCALTKD